MNRQRMNLLLCFVFITVLILSGCTGHPSLNALDPQGTTGEKQLNLINWSLLLMVGVFAIVITIFVYVLIRYRKRKGEDRMPEQVHGNTKLEIIWTVIPIIALVALAFPTVKYTFELADQPTGNDVVNVKVKGYQYWWEFEYPDLGIKTAQELIIPVNKKVHIEIEANDVLHSFWVPALGGKTDVIPGKKNTMWLDAKKTGTYQGKCAELCGPGHALMDFKVFVKSDAEYNQWVKTMQQPVKTTAEIDKKGEELFKQNCMGCHAGSNSTLKTKGPDLSKFGTRNTIAGILPHTEKDLREWLQRPDELKPGTKMPRIDYLEKDELDALVHYLMNRKPVTSK